MPTSAGQGGVREGCLGIRPLGRARPRLVTYGVSPARGFTAEIPKLFRKCAGSSKAERRRAGVNPERAKSLLGRTQEGVKAPAGRRTISTFRAELFPSGCSRCLRRRSPAYWRSERIPRRSYERVTEPQARRNASPRRHAVRAACPPQKTERETPQRTARKATRQAAQGGDINGLGSADAARPGSARSGTGSATQSLYAIRWAEQAIVIRRYPGT